MLYVASSVSECGRGGNEQLHASALQRSAGLLCCVGEKCCRHKVKMCGSREKNCCKQGKECCTRGKEVKKQGDLASEGEN